MTPEDIRTNIRSAIDSPTLYTGTQERRNFIVMIDTKRQSVIVRDDEMLVCLETPFQIPVQATCIGMFGSCQTMKAFLPDDWKVELNIDVRV